MKYIRNGLENKRIMFVLDMVLFAIALYETDISPSFTMMFMTANFGLCGLGELIGYAGRRKDGGFGFCRVAGDVLFLAGMAFSFPAVYIYATGDDWLELWVKLTFAAGTALELLFLWQAKRRGEERGMLRECGLWISCLGASFALLCGVVSPMLLPYGAVILVLTVLRAREKCCFASDRAVQRMRSGRESGTEMSASGNDTEAKRIVLHPVKKWIKWAAAALIFIVMAGLLSNPYRVAHMFNGLGKGPEFLYANSEKVMDENTQEFLPGAQWLDTEGNLIQAHGGQI